ncbi:MAG TPA: TIGR03032 family protein [Caldilineae bacterium]|nr:TIGR03032 family protein [Caldilineae bacterium]
MTSSDPLRSVYTSNLPGILDHFGISLVVSTYQAGKVILVRNDDGVINTHFRALEKPMGIAVDGPRLTVGGKNTVWYYRDMPAVTAKLDPHGKYDACYIPRQVHITGDIDIHEMAWGGDGLCLVNTRFSSLCTLDTDHSFVPRWRPHFVSALAPEDRCHLNGVCMVDGRPKFVTALGETDEAGAWRGNKRSGGILMDVEKNEVLLRRLAMPHSPRLYGGRLWLLESGQGGLAWVDLPHRTWHTVATLPGFTRGVDFIGPLAFVGLSQVRETATFSDIPLVERLEERICGVWVVNIQTGETVAFLRFEEGVQEIFAVQILPHRFPEMLEFGNPLINTSYVVPDDALRDVPATLLSESPRQGSEEPFVQAINRGAVLLDEDRVEEAMALFEQARAMNPDAAMVYNNMGNAFTAQNRLQEAVAQYEKALALNPDFPDAHMNLGMALLKLGDLARGFREFDWRWQTHFFTPFLPPQPRWDGSPMPDKTLLVHTEQGAGDTIQFARYLPLIHERVGKVLLVAPKPLQALMATVAGVDELRGPGEIPEAAFDAYTPLMTVAGVLGATLETIPANIPYLAPPPDRHLPLPPAPERALRVGVAWAGNPDQGNDRNRSARLIDFTPLFEISGVVWYSLQVGERAQELRDWSGPEIIDLAPMIHDWGDTAALIDQLDLVISMDTGVAHLAGALGKPVWVLLCHAPDWRWMLDREDSPWYPTVRLFRQQRPKDWAGVMARVGMALQSWGNH